MGTARAAHLPRAVPSAEIVASPQQGHHFVTANNGSWNAQCSAHKAACSVSMFIAIKVIQISKVIVVRKIHIFCLIWKSLGHLKYPSNKTLKNLLHRFLSPPPPLPHSNTLCIFIYSLCNLPFPKHIVQVFQYRRTQCAAALRALGHTDTPLVWQARIWEPCGDTQSNCMEGKGKWKDMRTKESEVVKVMQRGIVPSSKTHQLSSSVLQDLQGKISFRYYKDTWISSHRSSEVILKSVYWKQPALQLFQ